MTNEQTIALCKEKEQELITPTRMETMNYIPQPVDTSEVRLPQELEEMVEEMEKNVHEI